MEHSNASHLITGRLALIAIITIITTVLVLMGIHSVIDWTQHAHEAVQTYHQ